jgi:tetratricopeptide (TPR) repeat protein
VAIEQLKSAIAKRPHYVEAMNNLATIYIVSGNYGPAIELLSTAVAIAPSSGLLYLNLGNALRGAKRWEASKAATKKAMAISPGLKGAVFNLGLLYYVADDLDNLDRMGRLNEAKRLFARYKNEMGASLKSDDEVHKYLKEVQVAMEREQTRMARAKERSAMEAERSKQRQADPSSTAGDGVEKSTDSQQKEDENAGGGDEGWF